MDRNQDLCSSLIKWLQTFELDAPHRTAEDISDGVAMAQALNQIDSEWFNEQFLSKIKVDAGSNRRIKLSNLRKVLDYMVDYYQERLCQQLTDFGKPDVVQISENGNRTELGRLLQLLLGCAVNGPRKQDFIHIMIGMEKDVLQVLMQAIQEIDSGQPTAAPTNEDSHDNQVEKLMQDLDKAHEERDQMAQKCHELDMQVSLLQEEKQSIVQENKKLIERLQETENPKDPTVISGSKYNLLKKEFDALKEEMFKVETLRDDSRLRVEIQEREIIELQTKLEDLQSQAEEARHLKDEVDILRETADKVAKYEALIESYKRKLDELSDLKRQLKILEEKNSSYMQRNLELEEDLKKQSTWKSQVEMYKKQTAELHQKLGEETRRADRFEFEGKKSQEKIQSLTRDKERLTAERDILKESNEELKCTQFSTLPSKTDSDSPAGDIFGDIISPEIKEKIARLTHENKMLKLKLEYPGSEQLPVVQALLDDTKAQVHTLTTENRLANQKILELESQLSDIQSEKLTTGDSDLLKLRKELELLQSELRNSKSDNEKHKLKIEQQEELLEESNRKCTSLKEQITRKESEVEVLEEKYKKCIEKAKIVISSIEPKQNVELTALKSQLLEKNNLIQRLEKEEDRKRSDYENELKLVTSAFHRLASQRQRDSVDVRLAGLSSGQSFLARQRQPTNRRLPSK